MKYKVGDLVRILGSCTVGIVVAQTQHDHLAYGHLYELYLTNLKCCKIFEQDLEKL